MDLIRRFLALVDAYAAVRGVSDARISTLVFNDGARITQLRGGKSDVGANRLERAILWFSDNWPADTAWPDDLPRPPVTIVHKNHEAAE